MACHSNQYTDCSGHSQIFLLGTANSGKSALFNLLTGKRQTIGNWPGVTVDRKSGICRCEDQELSIVDLPGVPSLSSPEDERIDELITRKTLLTEKASVLIATVDPTALERSLAVLLQALDYGFPVVGVLGKADLWPDGVVQDAADKLSAALSIPVISVSAINGSGSDILKQEILKAVQSSEPAPRTNTDPYDLVKAVDETVEVLDASNLEKSINRVAIAHRLLEQDKLAASLVDQEALSKIAKIRNHWDEQLGDPTALVMAASYFNRAQSLSMLMDLSEPQSIREFSDKLDSFFLSRWFGVPAFFGVMYAVFFIAINVSANFIELFDGLGDALFVQTPLLLLSKLGLGDSIIALIASSVGAGLQTVLTFAPVVGLLFLCQIFLEQSGYMARAAVIADRMMRMIGMPGKAFIPLILGFGCTVPAVVSTRTLENRRERVMAAMMAPFMSCGARLPVYALFAAAFFPVNGQNIVFLLYLLGVVVAIFTGLLLSKSVYRDKSSDFVIELPIYQMPPLRQIFPLLWSRLKGFIFGAGKILTLIVSILSILNSVGTDGSTGNESNGKSVLAIVSKDVAPIFTPMGVDKENWPAAVGLVTGIFAKEAVVGTLQALYFGEDGAGEPAPLETASEAIAGFAASLGDLTSQMLDPLGIDIGDISSYEAASEEQEVEVNLFSQLAERFDGKVGALAYMIAVLLYMPCAAALAAIWREVGRDWALFASAWTTTLAYCGSVLTYQIGTFGEHPANSMAWILGIIGLISGIFAVMRYLADTSEDTFSQTVAAE